MSQQNSAAPADVVYENLITLMYKKGAGRHMTIGKVAEKTGLSLNEMVTFLNKPETAFTNNNSQLKPSPALEALSIALKCDPREIVSCELWCQAMKDSGQKFQADAFVYIEPNGNLCGVFPYGIEGRAAPAQGSQLTQG